MVVCLGVTGLRVVCGVDAGIFRGCGGFDLLLWVVDVCLGWADWCGVGIIWFSAWVWRISWFSFVQVYVGLCMSLIWVFVFGDFWLFVFCGGFGDSVVWRLSGWLF